MVSNPRTLRAMTRAGFITWSPAIEKHWTGARVRRLHVQPGPKLDNWSDVFRYRGADYRLHYIDGCFHPFVFEVGEKLPAFV